MRIQNMAGAALFDHIGAYRATQKAFRMYVNRAAPAIFWMRIEKIRFKQL